MIHLQGVTYTYPGADRPALDHLDLRIAEGEFVLVVGPSGAGKSTFLRCLNGLVPHFYGGQFAGNISVGGRNPLTAEPRGMSDWVGFVLQSPEAQSVADTVEDELAFAMENHNVPPALMRKAHRGNSGPGRHRRSCVAAAWRLCPAGSDSGWRSRPC